MEILSIKKEDIVLDTIEHTEFVLTTAAALGCLYEVVIYALQGMSDNPLMTTKDALNYGFNKSLK